MKKAPLIIFIIFAIVGCTNEKSSKLSEEDIKALAVVESMSTLLDEKAASFAYSSAIWAEDLQSENPDFVYAYNADTKVVAASVIKLQIMAAAYTYAAKGGLNLSESYVLKGADKVGGSGQLKGMKNGTAVTYEKLIEMMMAVSDNSAANILIKKIGMDNLNSLFKELGCTDTALNALVLPKVQKESEDNYTTVSDCALILRKIYKKICVNPEYDSRMQEILKKQKVRNRIPRFLPEEAVVGNKTGTLNGYFHDAAIVYTPRGDFIFCALVYGDFTQYQRAKNYISDTARMVYDFYSGYAVVRKYKTKSAS